MRALLKEAKDIGVDVVGLVVEGVV